MYHSKHVGILRVDPHTYATLSKWTGITTPQGLYDVLRPLMNWPTSKCIAAWHGRESFSMVFPDVSVLPETAIERLNVSMEKGDGKAFIRLNNSFLPVEMEGPGLEDAFPDHLLTVHDDCFVVPGGGVQALRKSIRKPSVPKEVMLEPMPTAMATIVVEDDLLSTKEGQIHDAKRTEHFEKELKAAKRRASRLEKRIRKVGEQKKNLEDHVAILQSSVKSLAEVSRNQKRGESYYQALSPILSNVKRTGQDVGLLTKGLGKVYQTLLELNGEAPFEALDDLDRALKWVQKKKKTNESFEGCLVRLDTHNQCLQKLNRTLLERLSKEKQATKVACKRLGMEAIRSTLLEERIRDMDREYDEGFFQMLAETLACSMEEEGVTDFPVGKHLLYDAQGLLREGGWNRMTKAWAVAEPFEGAFPNASGEENDFLMWETTSGADWNVALPKDATFADAEALLVEALGVQGAVFFHGFSGWPTATFVVEVFDASMRVADVSTSIRFLIKKKVR